jgi:hypothetical protein
MKNKQTLNLCIIVFQVLKEVDLGKSGDITVREFVHAVTKMPDFATCFQLKV